MKKRLRWVIIFILIIAVCVGSIFLVRNIKVQSISCESQYGPCNKKLELAINKLQNEHKNIFETRSELGKLVGDDNSVLDFALDFKFPIGLKVNVVERKAIAAFKQQDSFLLVDKEGTIVGETKETGLPKVDFGSLDKESLKYAANLVSSLYTFYGVSSVKINNDGMIAMIGSKEVIFPKKGDKDEILGALALILSRLPRVQEATTIRTIDLRFKNPILK